MKISLPIVLIFSCAALAISSGGQTLTDDQLSRISFDQKLGAQVSLDLPFRDENGKNVTLRDYFGRKPVVFVLGYYECPMLCTLTFNGMVEAMNDMKWSIGDQFNVVHVSINPNETPQLAAAKKATYVRRYGRPGAEAGWHFLTGEEPAIRKLADEVGFHYAYDPAVKQYAHPSGLIVLTPEGKTAKYFFGVKFAPAEVYAALQGASENKVGSPIERLVLLCFHYSPIHGKYGALIMDVIRILGAVTLAGMVWFGVAMVRRERLRRVSPAAGATAGSPAETTHKA
ncbi:MAG TPA: SCO family protein [Verrucomicrobiae bacterium]|jgi:protein SCO1/2|nr:SCO family protein [Verrucomicrobiae bacterium]